MNEPSRERSARRVGRIAGIVLFAVLITAFTAVCSVEIILQAWAAPDAPRPPEPGRR